MKETREQRLFSLSNISALVVSERESEEYQQIGLGSFHMRNYPAPYRIVFVVNALNSSAFFTRAVSEKNTPYS